MTTSAPGIRTADSFAEGCGANLARRATLLDLVDRVLDKGVVLAGDLVISVADIDLIYVNIRAFVGSVECMQRDRTGGMVDRWTPR